MSVIFIAEGIRDALGNEIKIAYARIINLESKPDKFDARVLVSYNLYISYILLLLL